jgi:hypothetical protein
MFKYSSKFLISTQYRHGQWIMKEGMDLWMHTNRLIKRETTALHAFQVMQNVKAFCSKNVELSYEEEIWK